MAKLPLTPEEQRVKTLRRYGLTPDDYDDMLAAQLGCCAICGTQETGDRWETFHVDHCHRTGVVRALLCSRCNLKLGIVEDEVWMDEARAYLEQYG